MLKNVQALSFFSSSLCQLDCQYCYIKKQDKTNAVIHKSIVEEIESGKFLKNAIAVFGDNKITDITFWGAEPALGFDVVSDNLIEPLLAHFKDIKRIGFSTNFVSYKPILRFMSLLLTQNPIVVQIQVSLDGQKDITDKNRGQGVTERIIANLRSFIAEMNIPDNISVKLIVKATQSAESLRYLDNNDTLLEYLTFFVDLDKELKLLNTRKQTGVDFKGFISMELPGEYTVEDGKVFASVLKRLYKDNKEIKDVYSFRLLDAFRKDFFTSPSSHTCSSGSTQYNIGLKNEIHACHNTLYNAYQHSQYTVNDTVKDRHFHVGNAYEQAKQFYVNGGYSNFVKFRVTQIVSAIKQLELCGQVKVTDPLLLACFINSAMSCPINSAYTCNSLLLQPYSIIKLFGNGAFDIMLDVVKG